jgi:hypothetical protein
MPETSPETAAKIAEFKKAPARVKRVAGFGTLLGVIVLLCFCASAFAGHVGWGRALLSGVLQLLLLWFVSFSVLDRQRWAWWALLMLISIRMWGGFAHTLRIVRITIEGGLAGYGRDIVFDAVGVSQLVISGVLLWLVFSKDVRDYANKAMV